MKKEWNERFDALLRAFYDAVCVPHTSGLNAMVSETIILEN